jgi:hypothetical protein
MTVNRNNAQITIDLYLRNKQYNQVIDIAYRFKLKGYLVNLWSLKNFYKLPDVEIEILSFIQVKDFKSKIKGNWMRLYSLHQVESIPDVIRIKKLNKIINSINHEETDKTDKTDKI